VKHLIAAAGIGWLSSAGFAAADTQPAPSATLVLEGRTAPLGYTGDFDHLAVDLAGKRLFLAAEDHGTLEVFDLASGKHLKSVGGFETPHAIVEVPRTHRLLITDGSQSIKLLDDATLAVAGAITLHPGADSVGFDAASGHLFVVTGGKDVKLKESWLEAIDPVTTQRLGELHLDAAHVEAMAVEQKGGRIFLNVADKNTIAVIDKASLKLIANWPIEGARQNALAELDEANHRLYVVARQPGKFIALDTATGKVITSLPAPAHVDAEVLDAAAKRVYATGGEGYVAVYSIANPAHVAELGHVPSAPGATTAVLVPELHRLYVAVSPGEGKKGGEVLWFRTN